MKILQPYAAVPVTSAPPGVDEAHALVLSARANEIKEFNNSVKRRNQKFVLTKNNKFEREGQ